MVSKGFFVVFAALTNFGFKTQIARLLIVVINFTFKFNFLSFNFNFNHYLLILFSQIIMVQAYNFLASWQLFPEKCNYEKGLVPKSGTFKIENETTEKKITLSHNWVTQTGEAFYTSYDIVPNNTQQPFTHKEIAESYIANIDGSNTINIKFFDAADSTTLTITKQIQPNGYLKVTQAYTFAEGEKTNIDIYHKQMSVLPYSSSVGSVAIMPTKAGMIKHKALTAMEEQTNMQLDQIRQQIELLARQAQELRKRKELSLMIYESKLNFKPQIGQTYHLYEKHDNTNLLSLVAPQEWGTHGPFKQYISSVKLLADHTWMEIN